MAGAGAPLALAGLGDAGLGDTAPSMSWDSTNALMLDATPGTGASATILNNTAAPLDVALQVDVPAAIAVTPATLSIPAGGTKAIKVGVLDPAVPGDGPGVIPLTSPSSCANLTPVDSPLGYLHSDRGEIGTVSAACTDQDGHAALELGYAGLGLTGATYTGDVNFGDAKVAVSVRRTAGYVSPVVALLAGFAVALWILGRAPSRVIKPLRQWTLQLRAAIGTAASPGTAVRKYLDAAAGAPWGDLDFWDDATTQIGGIEADLTALSKAKRFSLTDDSTEVKDLRARIAAADGCTKDISELGQILKRVQTALPVVESTNKLRQWTVNTRSSGRPSRCKTVIS